MMPGQDEPSAKLPLPLLFALTGLNSKRDLVKDKRDLVKDKRDLQTAKET